MVIFLMPILYGDHMRLWDMIRPPYHMIWQYQYMVIRIAISPILLDTLQTTAQALHTRRGASVEAPKGDERAGEASSLQDLDCADRN